MKKLFFLIMMSLIASSSFAGIYTCNRVVPTSFPGFYVRAPKVIGVISKMTFNTGPNLVRYTRTTTPTGGSLTTTRNYFDVPVGPGFRGELRFLTGLGWARLQFPNGPFARYLGNYWRFYLLGYFSENGNNTRFLCPRGLGSEFYDILPDEDIVPGEEDNLLEEELLVEHEDVMPEEA